MQNASFDRFYHMKEYDCRVKPKYYVPFKTTCGQPNQTLASTGERFLLEFTCFNLKVHSTLQSFFSDCVEIYIN